MVLVASVTIASPIGLRFVLPGVVLAVGLALAVGAGRRAAALALTVALMIALGWVLPALWSNAVTAVCAVACAYLVRFVVVGGLGMHLVATTSPTRLAAALRAWHAPRVISVTLGVVLRVFPVVAGEALAVLDAMRLRGLAGPRALVRHPVLGFERFVVPMIAASLRATDDLSASAILRGLGSTRVPTALDPPRFGPLDLLVVLAGAALAASALVLPSPLG